MNNFKFRWIGWCHQDGHDKVWAVLELNNSKYAAIWGRRGKALQTKIINASSSQCEAVIRNKRNKGYAQYTPAQLEAVYPDFKSDLEKTAFWATLQA